MIELKRMSWMWMLASALACALIVPVALAEEAGSKAEQDAKQEARPAEDAGGAEPAALRVEEGRTMTNLQVGSSTTGAVGNKKKVQIPEGQVFTNALLDQLFGPTEPPESAPSADTATPSTPGSPSAPDPLKAMQDGLVEQRQRERMIADTQKELEAARAKLANLETQLLATRNPFSARPELSDEEKEIRANADETASERYERTSKLVEEARAEVKAAEEKLASLRAGQ